MKRDARPAFEQGFRSRCTPSSNGPAYQTGQWRMEFRAEAFNATNSTNFDSPGNQLGIPGFGVIGSAQDNRQIELGLRLKF
ncbi:MAG: hypothetical protein FJW39_11355 [Acidobacteria bacterium]|nr:hypothetical protein [Acidobacteriota bacterium]